jgi:hypothetical protein
MYNYVGSDVHHNNHIAAFEQKSKIERFGTIKRSDSQQSVFLLGNHSFALASARFIYYLFWEVFLKLTQT